MAKLVLHIGSHKTATSYLQRTMFHNRELLERAGIFYPDIGPNPAHHILTTPWIDHPEIPASYYEKRTGEPRIQKPAREKWTRSAATAFSSFRHLLQPFRPKLSHRSGPDLLWERVVADYARRPGTLFISAEPFSRAAPQAVDFADLASRTRTFDEVKVIYVLRRQPELIQSIWLQLSKSSAPPNFKKFVINALHNHQCSGLWLDHGRVLDMVLKGFTQDQVTLLDYDQIRRSSGGVLGAFLTYMGSDLRLSDFTPVSNKGSNPSPDPLETYIACRIAAPDRPSQALTANVAQALSSLREGQKTAAYTAEEYSKVLRIFAPLNAALTERLQATQPGFRFDNGIEPPSNLIWRDMIDTSTWLALAKSLGAD